MPPQGMHSNSDEFEATRIVRQCSFEPWICLTPPQGIEPWSGANSRNCLFSFGHPTLSFLREKRKGDRKLIYYPLYYGGTIKQMGQKHLINPEAANTCWCQCKKPRNHSKHEKDLEKHLSKEARQQHGKDSNALGANRKFFSQWTLNMKC